jgi:CDP-glucose 4,6-dehydratase
MPRLAITGASGLLGSHLSNYYIDQGFEVSVLLKDEHFRETLPSKVNKVYGDINNRNDVDYFVSKSLPRYFVHLAAQTQAYDSLKYPYNTFHTNVIGTLNVLESLREFDQSKAIIVASSDKAYGELIGTAYTENHPLNGTYPYDASKSMTDMVSNSYRMTYGMPIITTRACNMYGPGELNPQRLIPGIINAFKSSSPFVIRNNGEDIREYIHVRDVVSAYALILNWLEHNSSAQSFNISSGERLTTLEVFRLVEKAVGQEIPHKIEPAKGLEIKKQYMDSSLLTDLTGWRPQEKLSESLGEILKWHLT